MSVDPASGDQRRKHPADQDFRQTPAGSLTNRAPACLAPPAPSGDLAEERRRFLLEEAQELYWNELSWEQVTEEEGIGESGLVEFTFPGFLAFVEGLLLREVMPDSLAPARPRPEVVEDILLFLATRCVELEGSEDPEAEIEHQVTLRLIDLVLYRQHDIQVEEVERLEEETPPPDQP